jgi:cytoskeleton protein RodZ
MAAEAGGDGRAGIGTRLRAAREKKGLSILQAAERMHVDPRIVEWLEAENFAALGAAVYARGHLRHYAELVDEEAAQLQELYANSSRAVPVQPDLTRIAHAPVESDSGKLAGSAVAVLIIIAAAGTLWWFLNSPKEDLQPRPVQGSEQTSSAGQPVAAAEIPGTASATRTPDTRATTGAQGAAASTEAIHAATSAPVAKNGGPSHSTTPPDAPTTTTTTATATKSVSSASPTTRGKDGELTLTFSSDSWAEVYDASGQRLFYDVGAASTAHTVRGAVPMHVVLGNAAGVTLEFNGRPAPVPSGVASDGSARFVITARGRAVSASDGG